jgi:hypothetical protein
MTSVATDRKPPSTEQDKFKYGTEDAIVILFKDLLDRFTVMSSPVFMSLIHQTGSATTAYNKSVVNLPASSPVKVIKKLASSPVESKDKTKAEEGPYCKRTLAHVMMGTKFNFCNDRCGGAIHVTDHSEFKSVSDLKAYLKKWIPDMPEQRLQAHLSGYKALKAASLNEISG